MNTNQDATLTNQDVMLDLYKIHAYIPNDAAGNPLTPFGNFCEGYQAATKASEQRIQTLEYLIDLDTELHENSAKTILELEAHVNQLREALEAAMNDDAGWYDMAKQATSSLKAAS